MVLWCVLFPFGPEHGRFSDDKWDSKTMFVARQMKGLVETIVWHKFALSGAQTSMAMIESKLSPWMFEA